MALRRIVKIDEEKCDGCGLCVPACAEGAIRIIDGKARLINERFCDGLGACLGDCPNDAITIEEREAETFDEELVQSHLVQQEAAKGATASQPDQKVAAVAGCPSCTVTTFEKRNLAHTDRPQPGLVSELSHWPIQLKLVPSQAPFFAEADLLIAADCVPFAYADFHEDLLKGKAVVIGCPKLDDINYYVDKLADILKDSTIRSVTVARMEVPCCSGLTWAAQKAIAACDREIPFEEVVIGAKGERKAP